MVIIKFLLGEMLEVLIDMLLPEMEVKDLRKGGFLNLSYEVDIMQLTYLKMVSLLIIIFIDW